MYGQMADELKCRRFVLFELNDPVNSNPYKNEKVAARLELCCCYYAAIKYVCNNWWRQCNQLERLVACLQLLSADTGSQSNYSQSVAASGCHKQEDSKNSFFII